jgi:NAD(P)H-hydrate epimerase
MKITLHAPGKDSHKGENGKLLIVGGSKQYHGAAMLAVLAARRFVDLVYFYPGDADPLLLAAIKSIPEVIVVDSLRLVDEMDCVLVGPGLGKARLNARVLKAKKLVVDGDGLKRVKGRIPRGAVLTPHEGEFRMLFGRSGTENNVKAMADAHGCIILKKGPVDIISDGKKTITNKVHNPGMTKGGTGDVLAGLVAALACKNDSFKAAEGAAWMTGNAGNRLKRRFGYNFCASDLADELAKLR